ncbi:hypothetical protein Pcinc_011761 [Petrolisthes cinctipes]|uniref:Uncharacterized protein n=1 Tax=Petrolisthes cinctipes TaxID=88211 RepID=A0AAE1G1Z7_PETCI|nr:hypothetical protein Pcinc_011761 [Petrolisthes cinctipes]
MPHKARKVYRETNELCLKAEVKVLTKKEVDTWLFSVSDRMTRLSSGVAGKCYLLQEQNQDLVFKMFKNIDDAYVLALYVKWEIKYLCLVKGIPGLQQLVAACPKKHLIVSEYAGETLLRMV